MEGSGAAVVQNLTSLTADLLECLNNPSGSEPSSSPPPVSESSVLNYESRIRDHLNSCYEISSENYICDIKNPVEILFSSSCEWINVNEPCLSTESTSNIIIFEFFTHCCINCIHSINELRQTLSELKEDRKTRQNQSGKDRNVTNFKLISVHSPKFSREQDRDSIRAFVERMSMGHSDVVNDPERTLWQKLDIFCWPTLLVFGPNPGPKSNELNLIFALIGEGHGKELKLLLDISAKYFDETNRLLPQNKIHEAQSVPEGSKIQRLDSQSNGINAQTQRRQDCLHYPGKVNVRSQKLAIADSGNSRILISTLDGLVEKIIGNGVQGFSDGGFSDAQFSNPQGLAFDDDDRFLYVADTGNHAIRQIDLTKNEVVTLVGSKESVLVNDKAVTLKSPWDLAFYLPEVLLICAAGNHQIFGYFFQQTQLFRTLYEAKSLGLVAGTGKEENRNNSYILKSSFAQPSGISVSSSGKKLVFVADSESSSIRMIEETGKVVGLVGGSRDPTDLFAYGDQDGISYEAKLQHPVGVCANADGANVFVADTYNHKVKMVELGTKRCCTLIGDIPGDRDGRFSITEMKRRHSSGSKPCDTPCALLNEPGGLSFDGSKDLLFIADTNNHAIKIANFKDRTVNSLKLLWDNVVNGSISGLDQKPTNLPKKDPPKIDKVFEIYRENKLVSIELRIKNLPENVEGGEWRITSSSSALTDPTVQSGTLKKETGESDGRVLINRLPYSVADFSMRLNVFLCSKSSCYMRSFNFSFVLKDDDIFQSGAAERAVQVDFAPNEDAFDK